MAGQTDRSEEHFLLLETAFGWCGIAWSAVGLTRLQLPEATPETTRRRLAICGRRAWEGPLPAAIDEAVSELGKYFSGKATDFAGVDVDLGDRPPLQLALYARLRLIPWGETTSYGALARDLAIPGGARAVGQAMGRNPVPVIVPCHRVLASGNGLGGFSAPGGRTTKQRLLELERANSVERLPLFAPKP
jgi:methylated-DNA-[protein]-cysteine S-methyltransferase